MSIVASFRVASLVVLASAAVATSGPAVAAGGLFDFLGSVFNGPPSAPPAEEGPGLDVTVHARRAKPSIRRRVEARQGKVVQTAINPVEHPNWYLEDPTLRRGDIVVLPGQVLVYEGGGRGSAQRDDFASLSESRLISKADRRKIGSMTGPNDAVVQTSVSPELRPRTASAVAGGE